MKSYLKFIVSFAVILSIFSCSKGGLANKGNKHIRYHITGNIGKSVVVQYTPTITDLNNTDLGFEETISLPWSKNVELHYGIKGVGCSISTEEAVPGATATIEIFHNEIKVNSKSGTVDSDGNISFLLNHYF